MGAKFLHTHVRTGKAEAVAKALCKLATSRKVTLAEKDEPCDHEVVVATHPDSPGWTSIYGRFDDVSWELSDKLATHVVELSIFDGDVLEARLANDGCQVDVFCTDPEYAGKAARAAKGQPKRWDDLCIKGRGWRDIQRVFKSAAANPEAALVELGKLIGLDHGSLYPDHVDPAGPKVRRLRFKAPAAPRRRILQGAPRVVPPELAELDRKMSLSDGAQSFGWFVESKGGGANGVEIAIGGTAIDSGLIAIESVLYRNGAGSLAKRMEDGKAWGVAAFPTAGFPAASGVVFGTETEPKVANNCPHLAVGLNAVPQRQGTGELNLRFAPLDPAAPPWVQRWKVRVVA